MSSKWSVFEFIIDSLIYFHALSLPRSMWYFISFLALHTIQDQTHNCLLWTLSSFTCHMHMTILCSSLFLNCYIAIADLFQYISVYSKYSKRTHRFRKSWMPRCQWWWGGGMQHCLQRQHCLMESASLSLHLKRFSNLRRHWLQWKPKMPWWVNKCPNNAQLKVFPIF